MQKMNKKDRAAAMKFYGKYRNRNPRCGYPFEPSPAGYCWSYAHHVDGTKGFEEMSKEICPHCELFHPRRKAKKP